MVYQKIIIAVVVYRAKTWTIRKKDEGCKLWGPWHNRTNGELQQLFEQAEITTEIKRR